MRVQANLRLIFRYLRAEAIGAVLHWVLFRKPGRRIQDKACCGGEFCRSEGWRAAVGHKNEKLLFVAEKIYRGKTWISWMERGWDRGGEEKPRTENDGRDEESGAKRAYSRTWREDYFFEFSGTNICIHARNCGEGGRTSVVLPPQESENFFTVRLTRSFNRRKNALPPAGG